MLYSPCELLFKISEFDVKPDGEVVVDCVHNERTERLGSIVVVAFAKAIFRIKGKKISFLT